MVKIKSNKIFQTIESEAPDCWEVFPCGEYYCKSIEQQFHPWFAKMHGFYLLKIGNLSSEINSENCPIFHHVNVSLSGKQKHIVADPLHLPFSSKSVDACLIAHTLPWCHNPQRLFQEVERVLIDDGWLIFSGFNPLSLVGLRKISPLLRKYFLYKSKMIIIMRELHWLSLLNFEIVYYNQFHVLPWKKKVGKKLFSKHFPILGGLQIIIARKRNIPLIFTSIKKSKKKISLYPSINATYCLLHIEDL